MHYSMRTLASPFLWVVILLATIVVGFCEGVSNISCHESEKQALLRFKQGLTDPSNLLASWTNGENCCDWARVVCDNLTGHVVELHLRNPHLGNDNIIEYQEYKRSKLGGKISDSLINLKHLQYLDLSFNDFGGSEIPKFLGSMQSLRFLALSRAGFGGMVPSELGKLSNLHYLNLNVGYFNLNLPEKYTLYVQSLQWLSRLSALQHLDMSWVDLGEASDWLQVMNTHPLLKRLHLSGCQLDHVPYFSHVNFSSLVVLDLSYNHFRNSLIPTWICGLGSLVSLDLSFNNFQGPIPDRLQNVSSLRKLALSNNNFNSSLPKWLHCFSHLKKLVLAENQLQGAISEVVVNLTSIVHLDLSNNYHLEVEAPKSLGNLCKLQEINLSGVKVNEDISNVLETLMCVSDVIKHLNLEGCQLFGRLTGIIGQFKNLDVLGLSNNSISGPLPAALGALTSLSKICISRNQFNGTLPEALGQLSMLDVLYINHNSLEGNVSEVFFANLARLTSFDASENSLTLAVSPDWNPPLHLGDLSLSSLPLGPQFPQWLCSLKYLYYLDISNAGIRGEIPTCLWDLSSQLAYLNLSHNHFHGNVPDMPVVFTPYFDFAEFDLSSNHFEGPLPAFLSSNITVLDLSNNLISGSLSHFLCCKKDKLKTMGILRLGHNQLSGGIPDCWTNWQSLVSVELQNNNLTGNLPNSIGCLTNLKSLHLRNNNLSGPLPHSLKNCTQLLALDLGENKFVGSIPSWMGDTLSNAMILSLRSNYFHGPIPNKLCALKLLQILDLAHNNLSGKIPKCFFNYTAMAKGSSSTGPIHYKPRINFVGEQFSDSAILVMKGIVLEYSKTLHLVRAMDLSSNNLSGNIPQEITNLLGLHSLNLSKNLLLGKIPENIGNMGSLESLDLSFNKLSGEIPSSMSKMTFLEVLDLSHNNLTGKIPTSTQLQSFNVSSFMGNNLCGLPVSENCSTDDATPGAETGNGTGYRVRVDAFYVSLTVGLVVGFWGVVAPLLYSRSWRFAYFQWLDNVWYKICHVIASCW